MALRGSIVRCFTPETSSVSMSCSVLLEMRSATRLDVVPSDRLTCRPL